MLLWFVLLAAALYTVVPDLFLHRLGLGSWKRQFSSGAVLTFDDGPDPQVTPQVLDILHKYQVPAVFFLVGEKAKAYPELVKRMIAEGHQVGLHSRLHRYAWLVSPWQTWREWEEGAEILENLTGTPVQWMRPPWGTFNLVTWLWLKLRGKKAVLWNVDGREWQKNRSGAQVIERVLSKANEGAIIVLHDGGSFNGERKFIVPIVEEVCQRLVTECKLPWRALEFPSWSLFRRIGFRLWEKWEHFYAKSAQVERLDAVNILRLSKARYHGPELYDENGELLAKTGDIVGEIHIDSIRLQFQGEDMQKLGIQAMRQARESLPALAAHVVKNPAYQEIQVFLGLSLLHRGVKHFGFAVQDVPVTWGRRWVAFLQRIIMAVYHPAGKARLQGRFQDQPKLVWISKAKLLERWLPPEERAASAPELSAPGEGVSAGLVPGDTVGIADTSCL